MMSRRGAAASQTSLMLEVGKALSCENRLALLVALADRPATVSDLVGVTGTSQPNVSNHLALLRAASLVKSEKSGRTVEYQLATPQVADLVHALVAVVDS